MGAKLRQLLAIAAILLLAGTSILALYRTSFSNHTFLRDTNCLNFLNPDNPCKYVKEKVQVTNFKPFNHTVITAAAVSLAVFVIIIALLTIGGHGLSRDAVVLFMCLGILVLGLSVGGFLAYGNKERKGHELVIGGVTPAEQACVDSLKTDLNTLMRSLGSGAPDPCSGFTFEGIAKDYQTN